jgi:cytochrome c peroxidase
MNHTVTPLTAVFLTLAGCALDVDLATGESESAVSYKLNALEFDNPSGISRTYTDNPHTSLRRNQILAQPFFQSLGVNGRTCGHCHLPGEGWTITPARVQRRFTHPLDLSRPDCVVDVLACPAVSDPEDRGLDPIFRLVDGANSPDADVSSVAAREEAYSMLLSKAVIRVGIGIQADAQFELAAVDDPYGYASPAELSLFRRPLPSANLRLSPEDGQPGTPVLTGVMWDGRLARPGHDIIADLLDQADGAVLGHAQATAGLTEAQREAIVEFETGLHTAQTRDDAAGNLRAVGGQGGPDWLAANQPFYLGINDVLAGDYETGEPFTPDVFTIYDAWTGSSNAARARIARGQEVFNRKPIAISGVGGLNDALGIEVLDGTCTTCHDSPNYGHHSVPFPIDIGTSDGALRTPDMPLYTLRNLTTGETVETTDPGRALVTGKWRDIGKFKGPILRGLAARPPYFHNGMAATIEDAIEFYDQRFAIGLTAAEKADLAAFLLTL